MGAYPVLQCLVQAGNCSHPQTSGCFISPTSTMMQNLTVPYSPAALGETIVPVHTNGEERGDTLNIVQYCDWGLSCSWYEVRLPFCPGIFIKRLRLSAHASSPRALGRNFQYQGAERTFYKFSACCALCVFSRKVLVRMRILIIRILMRPHDWTSKVSISNSSQEEKIDAYCK